MESGNEHTQDERLKEQIAKAQATALPKEEVDKMLLAGAELSNLFLQGKISGKELKQRLRVLNHNVGVIKTEDPEEFRRILELIGCWEEVIQKFINDEMPHYEAAKEQGLRPILRVQFFKIDAENCGLYPQTEVTYPDELYRKAHRKTLAAPGEANLSNYDRKGLGLNKKEAVSEHEFGEDKPIS